MEGNLLEKIVLMRHVKNLSLWNLALFACLAGVGLATPAAAQQFVRVPTDQATLQNAIAAVADGGVIEMAAGTYSAPTGGFTVLDYGKGFTIRAAAGAQVTLSGGNSTDILRFANSPGRVAHTMTFDRLTFASGASPQNFIGGALTIVRNNAVFTSCVFQNNSANQSLTGGGALWFESASVSFQNCTWTGNTSRNYGGGIALVSNSRAFLRDCTFNGNRSNLPNHSPNAAGGAIYVSDSQISIDNCRFEDNHAGYVGGAIYCAGTWSSTGSTTPTSLLVVNNSLFTGNSGARDPSVNFAPVSIGGAVHLEDQTLGQFNNCRFSDNFAFQGGAISSYRSIAEIRRCSFLRNHADGSNIGESIGGSIFATSDDIPDSSTANGKINRPATVLTIADSLFRGDGTSKNALQGGAIFIAGDLNSAYGRAGMDPNGTPASNRATLTLTRVAFADLVTTKSGGVPASSGAFGGTFITLSMDQSIIENCSTTDVGGGIELVQSVATIQNTTIARCRAGSMGGALGMFGGTLDLHDSSLVENQSTGTPQGAALGTAPAPASNGVPDMNIDGLVRNCVLSNNTGSATIWEGDRVDTPFNRLQYSSTQIFAASDPPFFSQVSGNQTVQQLNALTIPRNDGTTTVKSPVPNAALSTPPTVGAILLLPPSTLTSGAPGEPLPIQPFVVFASSGGRSLLDGNPTVGNAGVAGPTTENAHTLQVGSNTYSTTPPHEIAANISTRLPVGTGQSVLIGGFIIQGSQPKRVLVRGIGPSLNSILPGALQDPSLELHSASGALLASNDNWRTTQIGGILTADQSFDVLGTGIAPANEAEPAVLATLDPGAYTGIVRGANNTTGIALVEVYDLDPVPAATLANISTRGFVQGGNDVMIGGFILQGGVGSTQVVLRAIGPSLAGAGITNPLTDPNLELHDSNGATIISNDDWKNSPDAATLQGLGLQPSNDAESAIYQNALPRGAYTAIVRGKNGESGVGVLEAYVF